MSIKRNSSQIANLKKELQDIFIIYLESDVAGDNEDRRKKLFVFSEINSILEGDGVV